MLCLLESNQFHVYVKIKAAHHLQNRILYTSLYLFISFFSVYTDKTWCPGLIVILYL